VITIEEVLKRLEAGTPMPPLVLEERIHPDFPHLKITEERPCQTTNPNGVQCDGVEYLVKKRTLSDKDCFDYVWCILCEKCDVPKMLHKCFGYLSPDSTVAKDTSRAIVSKLNIRPEKNKHNESAMRALREMITNKENRASAILMGPTGTGKTFLAQHTLKAIIKKHKKRCVYLQESTLLNAWRASQDKNGADAAWGCSVIGAARCADMLMIDDYGSSRRTSDGALDFLEDVIMQRYDGARPVLITTNLSGQDIEAGRGARVWSRLKGMARENVFTINGGDFRDNFRWEV